MGYKGFRFKETEIGIFNQSSDNIAKALKHNDRVMGLTDGKFSLIDLIHSVLKEFGESHVVTTTWSAGIKDVHQVDWMLNTNLLKTFRIILDRSYKTRQGKYAIAIDELLAIDELFGPEQIRISDVHAKFVLIHNEDDFITIRTSMNLNANKTCESFEIDTDKDVFDFYMSFVEHTFGEMPKGFVRDGQIARSCVARFFNTEIENKYNSWNLM